MGVTGKYSRDEMLAVFEAATGTGPDQNPEVWTKLRKMLGDLPVSFIPGMQVALLQGRYKAIDNPAAYLLHVAKIEGRKLRRDPESKLDKLIAPLPVFSAEDRQPSFFRVPDHARTRKQAAEFQRNTSEYNDAWERVSFQNASNDGHEAGLFVDRVDDEFLYELPPEILGTQCPNGPKDKHSPENASSPYVYNLWCVDWRKVGQRAGLSGEDTELLVNLSNETQASILARAETESERKNIVAAFKRIQRARPRMNGLLDLKKRQSEESETKYRAALQFRRLCDLPKQPTPVRPPVKQCKQKRYR
ncbi:MAG: hypothetical protein IH602_23520 [Bryobacteraceae bacterium]|nr:hypothetical protein [Bryobacteraceae bacterium]